MIFIDQDTLCLKWNHAIWAQQGYVIICPNISGSTGFGLAFTKRKSLDAIPHTPTPG